MPATDVRTTPSLPGLLLRVVMVFGIVASVPTIGLGLLLVVEDAQEITEEWHGLGYFFGGLLSATGIVVLMVSIVVLVLLRTAPRAAATVVLVVVGPASAIAVYAASSVGVASFLAVVPLAAVGGLAAWTLAEAR